MSSGPTTKRIYDQRKISGLAIAPYLSCKGLAKKLISILVNAGIDKSA